LRERAEPLTNSTNKPRPQNKRSNRIDRSPLSFIVLSFILSFSKLDRPNALGTQRQSKVAQHPPPNRLDSRSTKKDGLLQEQEDPVHRRLESSDGDADADVVAGVFRKR